ncbi:hypothetical protein NE237_000017 [Protea cynaroides]|uniref:Uncharacterized protein n=1 Tax=Protea cynaroides TaxID=273540 RepID=A0A9Q0GLN4_9MAGN|nr:hypothetical protein NE237_000017 [Protea cynaroides]
MATSVDEQDSSSHDVGGDEVPAAAATLTIVVEMVELRELLGDVCSLVTTLDDQRRAHQTSLVAHKHEITYTRTALVIVGLIAPMPDDVATSASARRESTHRLRLRQW